MGLIRYIINPKLEENHNSLWQNIKGTMFYFCIAIAFSIIMSFVLSSVMEANGITENQNVLKGFFDENNRQIILLTAVVIGPIFEELVFRSILKPTKAILYLRMVGLIYIFGKGYFKSLFAEGNFSGFGNLDYIYILTLLVVVGVICYLINKYQEKIYKFFEKYFGVIFWLSCLSFGLVHIWNFDSFVAPRYIYVVMIIPQLVAGILLGYVRIHFGLVYAMMLHMMYNGLLSSMLLYFKYIGVDVNKISEADYIKELSGYEGGLFLILFVFGIVVFYGIRNIYKVLKQQDNNYHNKITQ